MNTLRMKKILRQLNHWILLLDRAPLWWVGLFQAAAVFVFLFLRGEKCVFPIHDQLDETILSYVLNAKWLGSGIRSFPELLGGLNVSGLQPSAPLFVLLYRIFPVLTAFLLQYAVVFLAAFAGMYRVIRRLTDSSILALAGAGCFCMLPFYPVYGLSVAGAPLLLVCCMNLWERRRVVLSSLGILFFGLTTHLVLIGYVALFLWASAILAALVKGRKKRISPPFLWGFLWLSAVYILVNKNLFLELLLGRGGYVSHREELVRAGSPFWATLREVFLHSAQHADSLHLYLILPIGLSLLAGACFYHRLSSAGQRRWRYALAAMLLLTGIAFFYAFCKSQPVVDFQNSRSGILRYFQPERFYWLYPSLWYLEFALCMGIWWNHGFVKKLPACRLAALCLILIPTLQTVKEHSYLYMNVNQCNNGSHITGYISCEAFYSEPLMEELEQVIGRDITSYRIVHLGINPTPALMHGFYTVDGYSNNYPLSYKHRFRRVMEKELKKAPQAAVYFDTWGSRCYLCTAETGNAYMLGKDAHITYHDLELDLSALRELGCGYIFSCGKIEGAQDMGLRFLGYYETKTSYWGVWLYELDASSASACLCRKASYSPLSTGKESLPPFRAER